jgi:hypothetical protein
MPRPNIATIHSTGAQKGDFKAVFQGQFTA